MAEESELKKTEIQGTTTSNNITFTEEISTIIEDEDLEGKSAAEETIEINKNMAEKENKLTVLLNEYKNRID